MSETENGEPRPGRSLTGEALALLDDQIELTTLELEYEKDQGMKRVGALAASACLGLTAFIILQVAIIMGLVAAGVTVPVACLTLVGIYSLLAALLAMRWGRRDPKAGKPFQGTIEEMHKNLKWIRQLLS